MYVALTFHMIIDILITQLLLSNFFLTEDTWFTSVKTKKHFLLLTSILSSASSHSYVIYYIYMIINSHADITIECM